jgi:hypothetical protein
VRHDGRGAQDRQVLSSVGDRWAAVGGGERRSVELVDLRHHGFFQIDARCWMLPLLSPTCGALLLSQQRNDDRREVQLSQSFLNWSAVVLSKTIQQPPQSQKGKEAFSACSLLFVLRGQIFTRSNP